MYTPFPVLGPAPPRVTSLYRWPCCQPGSEAIRSILLSTDQQTGEQKIVAWTSKGGAVAWRIDEGPRDMSMKGVLRRDWGKYKPGEKPLKWVFPPQVADLNLCAVPFTRSHLKGFDNGRF